MLINSMLIHSYVPLDCMLTCNVPLVKDKKGDLTSKDNYRPIALTCIISKVIELVLLAKYGEYLYTDDNQFGYKNALSTDLCMFNFKEIIQHYHSMSNYIYMFSRCF